MPVAPPGRVVVGVAGVTWNQAAMAPGGAAMIAFHGNVDQFVLNAQRLPHRVRPRVSVTTSDRMLAYCHLR